MRATRKVRRMVMVWLLSLTLASTGVGESSRVDGNERTGIREPNATATEVVFLGAPLQHVQPRLAIRDRVRHIWKKLRGQADPVARRYAHNIWDMQRWDGKIYLGYGNYANRGPATSPGPLAVVYYDLKTQTFITEFTVNEEQIDRYRVIDGQLYIPGHDPREPWELGNFYRRDHNGWQKMRTIPFGIHTFDILAYQGALFVAEGATDYRALVSRSTDGGQTWTSYVVPQARRAYELFTLDGSLYVSANRTIIARYTGQGFEGVHVDLFPDANPGPTALVRRSLSFKNVLLYLGQDHHDRPFAAYKASGLSDAQRLALPSTDRPYDILVRDDTAYILTNRLASESASGMGIIYASKDLETWTEVVSFRVPTIARSFEYAKGAFYLGLGTDTRSLHEASGHIYRVTPPK